MTEAERQRVLASRPLISDDEHDQRYRCPHCGSPWVVPDLDTTTCCGYA